MIITFKAIYALAPSYICELINIKESGGYNLRLNKGLLLQAPRVDTHIRLGECAFLAAAPKLWNRLSIIFVTRKILILLKYCLRHF